MSLLRELPEINLEIAISELERNSDEWIELRKLEGRIRTGREHIDHAVELANYVLDFNYSASLISELYSAMQEIALKRFEETPDDHQTAIFLTDVTGPYQIALRNLLENGMTFTSEEELPTFVELYIEQTKRYNELNSLSRISRTDVQDAQRVFLNSERENFIGAYLNPEQAKRNPNFYFERLKAVVDYVVDSPEDPGLLELSTPVRINASKFSKLLPELVPRAYLEVSPDKKVRRKRSEHNILDLYEFIHNAVNETEDTLSEQIVLPIGSQIPGFTNYHENRGGIILSTVAYLNEKVRSLFEVL